MSTLSKRLLLVSLIISVTVGMALAATIYQNNKTAPFPSDDELRSSLDNAVDWLYEHQPSIMKHHNPALWWMLKEASDISRNKKLKAFYRRYKSDVLDRMPNNIWTPYFNPYYTPSAPGISELATLDEYQIFLIYSLSCDADLGEEPVIQKQLRPDYCTNQFLHPRCVTHQQMGLRLLQQRNCGDYSQLSEKLLNIIESEIKWDFRVTDSYLQRVLMLAEGGRVESIKPVWLKRILHAQSADGGWTDFYPVVSLGDYQLGFSSSLPATGPKKSTFHATAQGIWLMALLIDAENKKLVTE